MIEAEKNSKGVSRITNKNFLRVKSNDCGVFYVLFTIANKMNISKQDVDDIL